MLFVEFAGCPGVGKSTICRKVILRLREVGFDAVDILRNELAFKLPERCLFTLSYKFYPGTAHLRKELCAYIAGSPSKSATRFGLEIQKCAYKLHTAKNGNTGILFQNEGPTQFITSIAYDKPMNLTGNSSLVEAVNESVYDCHRVILVYVTCGQDENIRRLMERGNKNDRYSSGDPAELKRLLDIKRRNLLQVKELFHYDEVIEIENTEIAAASLKVSEMLLERLK